jgi:hypothetical protein
MRNAGVIAILEHLTFLILCSLREFSCNATQIHGQQSDLFLSLHLQCMFVGLNSKKHYTCGEEFSYYVAVKFNFLENVLLITFYFFQSLDNR